MKKKITLLAVLIICLTNFHSTAQTFGNEWINYSQSYFKFKVAKDSIYRIPISSLTALGMPSTVEGANLQLIRDGQEIPILKGLAKLVLLQKFRQRLAHGRFVLLNGDFCAQLIEAQYIEQHFVKLRSQQIATLRKHRV